MHKPRWVLIVALVIMLAGLPGRASGHGHRIIINLPEYKLYHYIGNQLVDTYGISIGSINTPTPVSSPTRRFEIYNKVKHPSWKSPTTGVVLGPGPSNPLGTRWLGLMTIDRVTLRGTETWESLAAQYGTTVSSILRNNNLSAGAKIMPGMVVEIQYHDGYGIHGTNVPSSIGTSVSLGCMRMRNEDVERLFDILPNGQRIPVTILYEPMAERRDPITGEVYYEIFHDVYRRIKDWSAKLTSAAQTVGATVPQWLQSAVQQRFSGSYILSGVPVIQNNGVLLAVGAVRVENEFYLPLPVVERLLGELYKIIDGVAYLGLTPLHARDTLVYNEQVYLRGGLVQERAGRGYYYEGPQNTIEFSVCKLVVNGAMLGFNSVFLHPQLGPMVPMQEVVPHLGLTVEYKPDGKVQVGSVTLNGQGFGEITYMSIQELSRLKLSIAWDPAGGVLWINPAEIVTNP